MQFEVQTGRTNLPPGGKALRSLRLAPSFRTSVRNYAQHSGHLHEVYGRLCQLQMLSDAPSAAIDGLPDTAHRPATAEVLADALALDLAEPVGLVAHRMIHGN